MKKLKIFVLILVLIFAFTGCQTKSSSEEEGSKASATNVSIEEAKQSIEDQEDLFILDVRNKDEFDAGHIEGATMIPLDELKDRLEELVDYKDKPLLVYCRSGNRSSKAVDILLKNDFTQVYHMHEGFMNWK